METDGQAQSVRLKQGYGAAITTLGSLLDPLPDSKPGPSPAEHVQWERHDGRDLPVHWRVQEAGYSELACAVWYAETADMGAWPEAVRPGLTR